LSFQPSINLFIRAEVQRQGVTTTNQAMAG